jgi:hypothetical protein
VLPLPVCTVPGSDRPGHFHQCHQVPGRNVLCFLCQCPQCQDSIDQGTYISAIKCQIGRNTSYASVHGAGIHPTRALSSVPSRASCAFCVNIHDFVTQPTRALSSVPSSASQECAVPPVPMPKMSRSNRPGHFHQCIKCQVGMCCASCASVHGYGTQPNQGTLMSATKCH